MAKQRTAGNATGQIYLGDIVNDLRTVPDVVYDRDEFVGHVGSPWLSTYLHDHFDVPLPTPKGISGKRPEPFSIPTDLLKMHSLLCGASGYGKSRLALHLLQQQLSEGCSAVVMDIKSETIRQALYCAQQAGIKPEQITVLSPEDMQEGVPGWNPFDVEQRDVRRGVQDLRDLIKSNSGGSWGPRMDDILMNAATVIAAQRLSFLELVEFLRNADYRQGLLNVARRTPTWTEFFEEHRYFENEFAQLSSKEQLNSVNPVLNKIRLFVTNPYLAALTSARKNNLDLASLWTEQRLVLVHLDEHQLGEAGASLLGGMMAAYIFNTAMRQKGHLSVVLCLDEMGMQERLVGEKIKKILAAARSQNLRLLVACQHLGQLSSDLQEAVLTSTALRVYFHLGVSDAQDVASTLSAGLPLEFTQYRVSQGEVYPVVKVSYTLVDMWDQPISMSSENFLQLYSAFTAGYAHGSPPYKELYQTFLQWFSTRESPRLYVRSSIDGQTIELSRFFSLLPPNALFLEGSGPIYISVYFPQVRVKPAERQTAQGYSKKLQKQLREQPRQHAFVEAGGRIAQIKVTDTPFPNVDKLPEVKFFTGAAQDYAEIHVIRAERYAAIEQLSAKKPGPSSGRGRRENNHLIRPTKLPDISEQLADHLQHGVADDGSL